MLHQSQPRLLPNPAPPPPPQPLTSRRRPAPGGSSEHLGTPGPRHAQTRGPRGRARPPSPTGAAGSGVAAGQAAAPRAALTHLPPRSCPRRRHRCCYRRRRRRPPARAAPRSAPTSRRPPRRRGRTPEPPGRRLGAPGGPLANGKAQRRARHAGRPVGAGVKPVVNAQGAGWAVRGREGERSAASSEGSSVLRACWVFSPSAFPKGSCLLAPRCLQPPPEVSLPPGLSQPRRTSAQVSAFGHEVKLSSGAATGTQRLFPQTAYVWTALHLCP